MKTRISIILLSILIFSCETINPDIKTVDTPVVEAFIIPGLDSVSVNVRKMIGYMGTDLDTVQQPVTDCTVQLVHEGVAIQLFHDANNPGNYNTSTKNLGLKPGDTLGLLGQYQDILFSAQTVIPDSVQNLTISGTTLYYDSDNPRSMMTAGNITLEWENDTEDFYYVYIENTEGTLVPLNEMLEDAPKMGFAFPSKSDQFQVSMRNIRYYGSHRVIVYHVNQEFADLFDQSELTSNSIVEPPGNIENAFGVFTAMNADTVYFEVKAI